MTDNAVDVKRDPMQDFKDKVAERLRDQIGDLIPDEALAKMVEEAIHKSFFQGERINQGTDYRPQWVERTPWFVDQVKELVDERVKEAVILKMNERSEDLQKLIDERLDAGLSQLILKVIDDFFSNAFRQVEFNLQQQTHNAMQNIGN